ncbi:hypothetical protein EPUL_005040, partial [Erysiphe pulchra]
WIEARIAGLLHDWIHREANPLLAEALNINFEAENSIHAESYTTIVDTVESGSIPNTFFVQGPAGTGKIFLYTTLCSYFRAKGELVLCVASSGIASLLLPNGRTSHSTFRIPLDCDESSRCHIPKQSNLAKLLRRTFLIIWDEVTMQPRHHFDAVDRVLQDIRDNKNLYGGIPVVLGVDFAQILPVVKEEASMKLLILAFNAGIIGESNSRFASGLGDLSYNQNLYGVTEIPEWIKTTDDRAFFREFIFLIHLLQAADSSIFRDRAILTSRNDNVDFFNVEIAQLITVASHDYFSADQIQSYESGHISDYPPEYLQTLSGQGLPLGKLTLQIGMPIMLLRNHFAKLCLCNGTRLIITRLYNHCIKNRIISQDFDGKEHVISRITVTTKEDPPFTLIRKQLSIQTCYSMTINKSRDQTLKRVGVNLTNSVFSHGQFHVALSRVNEIKNMLVLLPRGTKSTNNVVYQEVLLRPQSSNTLG